MYENIIAWSALGLLLLLCLPFVGLQRFMLNVYGGLLRLGMVALVVSAGYLWYYPQRVPADVAHLVHATPLMLNNLPDPGTPLFGICTVALISIVMLPLLAVIDICRSSVRRNAAVFHSERVAPQPQPQPQPQFQPAPVMAEVWTAPAPEPTPPSRFGRRAAADALGKAASTH